MQRRINTKSSDGVGIYSKRRIRENKNKTERKNLTTRLPSSSSSISVIESDSNGGSRGSIQVSSINSRQLEATQQILDTLSDQFNSLNALKQNKSDSVVSSEYSSNNNNYYDSNRNFGCHVNIEQILSSTTKKSVKRRRHSRQALDNYVSTRVVENSNKCGCHFDKPYDSDDFLNESKEGYRKQCSSANYYTDLESSNISGSEILTEDDSVLLFGFDNIRHACLIEAEQSKPPERFDHDLFIEKQGQQCCTSVNIIESKEDKSIGQVNALLGTRQGPCSNHQAKRQQQQYSNDNDRISNLGNTISHRFPNSSNNEKYSEELHNNSFIRKWRKDNDEPLHQKENNSASFELNKLKLYYDNRIGDEQVDNEEEEERQNYEIICDTGNALESLTDSFEDSCGEFLSFQNTQTTSFEALPDNRNNFDSDPSKPLSVSNLDHCATNCIRLHENPSRSSLSIHRTKTDNNSTSPILSLSSSRESQFTSGIEGRHFQELQNIANLNQNCCANYKHIERNSNVDQTNLLNTNDYCLKAKLEYVPNKQGSADCYYFNELEQGSNRTRHNIWEFAKKVERGPLGKCCFSCEDLLVHTMGLGCNESSNEKCNTSKSESNISPIKPTSEEENEDENKNTDVAHHITANLRANKQHLSVENMVPSSTKQQQQRQKHNNGLDSNLSFSDEKVIREDLEQEKLSKKKRSSRGLSSLENVSTSMRALKDILKMQYPSLSSLQYLPGQIDSSRAKVNPKKRQPENNETTTTNSKVFKGKPIKSLENTMSNTKNKVITVVTESDENLKHDESCLFHRLCLCNCIARGNHNGLEEGAKEAGTSASTASDDKENQSREEEDEDDDDDSLKNLKTVKPSQSSCHSDGSSRENKTSSLKEYEEKQSPSFLNLLKSSPTRVSPASSYSLSPSSAHQRFKLSKNNVSPSSRRRFADGESVDELTASRDIGRNSTLTDNEGGESLCLSRVRSTSFSESKNQRETPLSSLCEDEVSNGDSDTRPQSACSIRENNKSSTKKGTSYRKLLSPSKLFSNNSSSNNKTNDIERLQQVSELREKTDDQNKHQKSFFSRSLNRLSNRSKRNKKYFPANHNTQVTDLNQLSRTCVSPTISISTASNINESLENSINSLDDLSLPLKVTTNSKVGSLNTVDFENSSNRSAIFNDMTRAKSYKYHHIGQNYQNNIYLNSNSTIDQHPARYGSEISGYTSTNSLMTSNDRALSLPPSPRGGTRQRNAPGGSSKSPRLTHSPVPFHSPATESTKIEDGLKVCSTEHFEKHIGNIKEIQLEAQKRLFKAWINHFCPNLIRDDLITELQDGIKLIGMLAYLTRDKKLFSQYDKLISDKESYINRIIITHSSRLRHLSNVSIAIDYLRRERKMKLINLNPMDIVCGRANVVLGLCWNIILNFQLEQNFLKYLESCDDASSQPSESLTSIEVSNTANSYTSRLSNSTNEDCARYVKQTVRDVNQLEEYTPNDLVKARKKLLDHINRRFDLKLTNLTSNLLDGEVLFVIIKNLIPECGDESQLLQNNDGKLWKSMNNDEKLNHCFDLALAHLNVPRLFSSVDLRQQTISDNNSKPLLVYLTMLLNTDAQSKHSEDELESLKLSSDATDSLRIMEDRLNHREINNKIEVYLEELEKDDRYRVDKLQLTLRRIKKLDELINGGNERSDDLMKNDNFNARYLKLKDEAEKMESLISWINQADALFETPQKSAQDLINSIERYKIFFSPENVPKIRASLCPTLERQYRECISTAQQRVHTMEQTLKNWASYEKARKLLRDWLVTAEVKLANALLPIKNSFDENGDDDDDGDDSGGGGALKPIEQHTDRLEDLIDYFELEPIDSILNETSQDFGHEFITSPTLIKRLNVSRMDTDSLPSSLSFNGDRSKSSSLLSICSTNSRMSTLQNCKKASYYKLFDDFELKCRLLAAMLDSDQREALLLGVKELRGRLKFITEQRVPQVVNELRRSINCCEMAIEEQDEDLDTSSIHEDDLEEASPVRTNLIAPCIEISKEFSSIDENADFRNDSGCFLKYQEVPASTDLNTTATQIQMDPYKFEKEKPKKAVQQSKPLSSPKIEPKSRANKISVTIQNNKNLKQSLLKSTTVKSKDSTELPWSFFSWLLSREPKSKVDVTQPKSKRSSSSSKRNKKSRKANRSVKTRSENSLGPKDIDEWPYASLIWHKVVRAYRASFSLNIVLLICLAGICVVPLIHKDACCELSAANIPPSDFSMSEKPT